MTNRINDKTDMMLMYMGNPFEAKKEFVFSYHERDITWSLRMKKQDHPLAHPYPVAIINREQAQELLTYLQQYLEEQNGTKK